VNVSEAEVRQPAADVPAPSRRPAVAGAAAGLWALVVGVALVSCLVMLAWAVSPNSAGDSAAAWRAAGYTWLAAHQVPLEIGARSLTLMPLGALALGLLLGRRGGRWAGRMLPEPSWGEVATVVASCAVVYGAGGAGVAWLSESPATGARPMPAFLGTALVAAAGSAWGMATSCGLVGRLRASFSDAAWRTVAGGLAAVVGLFAAGAGLVTASLVRHFSEVGATMAGLDAGTVGNLALTLLGIMCLPTLDIWGLSMVVGPGFSLGAGDGLAMFGGQVDVLPALPILAAVPTETPGWAPALLLVPIALGALAGRIRWGRDLPTLSGTVVSAAGLAAVVAALVAGLTLLASGSLGGGRLGAVGPSPVAAAASAAGLVVLGFLAEAAIASLRLSWELHRAEHLVDRAARPTPGHAGGIGAEWDTTTDPAVPEAEPGPASQAPDSDRTDEPPMPVSDAAVPGWAAEGSSAEEPSAGPTGPPDPQPVVLPPRVARRSVAIPVAIPVAMPRSDPVADPESVPTATDRGPGDVHAQDPGPAAEAADHTVDLTIDDAELALVRAARDRVMHETGAEAEPDPDPQS
jgi:hypothetical protein